MSEARFRTGERRHHFPGRRADDEERALISTAVREELRRQRRRWIATWLLTLALSSYAWYLATKANDRAQRTADDANRNAEIARKQGRQQCVRSKLFLPYFTQTLERASDIPPEELRDFRVLVPKHC